MRRLGLDEICFGLLLGQNYRIANTDSTVTPFERKFTGYIVDGARIIADFDRVWYEILTPPIQATKANTSGSLKNTLYRTGVGLALRCCLHHLDIVGYYIITKKIATNERGRTYWVETVLE